MLSLLPDSAMVRILSHLTQTQKNIAAVSKRLSRLVKDAHIKRTVCGLKRLPDNVLIHILSHLTQTHNIAAVSKSLSELITDARIKRMVRGLEQAQALFGSRLTKVDFNAWAGDFHYEQLYMRWHASKTMAAFSSPSS